MELIKGFFRKIRVTKVWGGRRGVSEGCSYCVGPGEVINVRFEGWFAVKND